MTAFLCMPPALPQREELPVLRTEANTLSPVWSNVVGDIPAAASVLSYALYPYQVRQFFHRAARSSILVRRRRALRYTQGYPQAILFVTNILSNVLTDQNRPKKYFVRGV